MVSGIHLQAEDEAEGNGLTSDRFKAEMYQFWTSKDPSGGSKYICGPFDSVPIEQLEAKIQHIA